MSEFVSGRLITHHLTQMQLQLSRNQGRNKKKLCLAARHDKSETSVIHLVFFQQELLKFGLTTKILMSYLILKSRKLNGNIGPVSQKLLKKR